MNMEDDKELTREERLEIEEQAIQALLQCGVKFTVPLKIAPKKPPFWSKFFPSKEWRDKRIPKTWDVEATEIMEMYSGVPKSVFVRHFHIRPLYLGTIDILRKKYLEIEFNEDSIQNNPLSESKELFKYIPLMAEIAAIAAINSSEVADSKNKQVKELKRFFIDHLTVDRLKKLVGVINQMMNPAGFTNSIRLMREVGTTKPTRADRIE